MTEDYYLINGQIKFYFDIEHQFIEYKGSRESLEPKESQILKYILENTQDELIKSEAILDDNWEYWSDKKVLQKVLSTLRKKFKNIGVTENGFVAVGTNYKINYNGELVNSTQKQEEEKSALRHKIIDSTKTAVIWAFAGAIALFAVIKLNETPQYTIDNVIQATAISGVSVEPALSPNGEALAFTHKKDNSSRIYIKVDSNLNYQTLSEGFEDQVPSWSPSGKQLAFQRKDKNICEIRVVKLNSQYEIQGPSQLITTCSQHTGLSNLTWQSEDILFFTERFHAGSPYDIKKANLITGTVSDYFTYKNNKDYGGSGHYFIIYNHKLKSLFSLESPNWVVSNISRVNKDNTSSTIRKLGDTLLSFSIFEDQIIFKDLDNQLKSFPLNMPDKMSIVFKNPLKPIGYPVVSSSGNKIALVSGSVFRYDLLSYNLNNKTISEIISSNYQLRLPQGINQEILYVSDETGIYQIYSYTKDSRLQLTNFTENRRIVYFTQSRDKNWLAINFIDGTILYRRSPHGITEVKSFPLMSSPSFSMNSKRLLIKRLVSNDEPDGPSWKTELVEYDMKNFEETGITIKNASFGVYHDKGIIFVNNDRKVKLFKLNEISSIYDGKSPLTPSLFAVNKDSIIISSTTDNAIAVNIDTREVFKLPRKVEGSITSINDNIYFKHRSLGKMIIFTGDLTKN